MKYKEYLSILKQEEKQAEQALKNADCADVELLLTDYMKAKEDYLKAQRGWR